MADQILILDSATGRLKGRKDIAAVVPTASETVAGKVALATTAEATTGTDTTRAVTPAGLKAAINAIPAGAVAVATTTVVGVSALATGAEVAAGADASKNVTPATVTSLDVSKLDFSSLSVIN